MKKLIFLFAFFCLSTIFVSAKDLSTNYRNALIFAYSPVNSVYEDENIKLEIYNEQLWATNKTKKTIFIDRSQCFLVHNGSSYPMWSAHQDEKDASKKGATTSIDEFVTIAPAMGSKTNETHVCNLGNRLYGSYSSTESPSEDFSEYDLRLLNIIGDLVNESQNADPKGKQYLGASSRHLTEDESVNNIGASIAYAFSKRSEDWTSVTISTWVSDIIFAPYYVSQPKDLSKKEKQGFGVKETKPAVIHINADSPFEFVEDKSPIIVADWEGNFKKGTFELKPTRIPKVTKTMKFTAKLAKIQTLGLFDSLEPFSETYLKSIIKFDGSSSDWGKMNYVNEVAKTEQK